MARLIPHDSDRTTRTVSDYFFLRNKQTKQMARWLAGLRDIAFIPLWGSKNDAEVRKYFTYERLMVNGHCTNWDWSLFVANKILSYLIVTEIDRTTCSPSSLSGNWNLWNVTAAGSRFSFVSCNLARNKFLENPTRCDVPHTCHCSDITIVGTSRQGLLLQRSATVQQCLNLLTFFWYTRPNY